MPKLSHCPPQPATIFYFWTHRQIFNPCLSGSGTLVLRTGSFQFSISADRCQLKPAAKPARMSPPPQKQIQTSGTEDSALTQHALMRPSLGAHRSFQVTSDCQQGNVRELSLNVSVCACQPSMYHTPGAGRGGLSERALEQQPVGTGPAFLRAMARCADHSPLYLNSPPL